MPDRLRSADAPPALACSRLDLGPGRSRGWRTW